MTYRFGTFIYHNVTVIVVIAPLSRHIISFLLCVCWESLRSSLLASPMIIIQYFCLYRSIGCGLYAEYFCVYVGTLKHTSYIISPSSFLNLLGFFKKCIYLFCERERESVHAHGPGRSRERGRERESQTGSSLSVQGPTRGSNPQTVRSWPEPKPRVGCWTDWATQAPQTFFFKNIRKREFSSCATTHCLYLYWIIVYRIQ